MNDKLLLFSVSLKDCDVEYMRGTGPGGQKRNKTESKVRIRHRDSGAVGESDETRSQISNKERAFKKMIETETFKNWHRLEIARKMGTIRDIEEMIDEMMKSKNLKIEGKNENGQWEEMEIDDV